MAEEEEEVVKYPVDSARNVVVIDPALRTRRSTIAEESAQALLDVQKEIISDRKASKRKTFKEKMSGVKGGMYNSEYREFLTRDSLAWFKLCFFYSLFFAFLSLFFCGLLYLFYLSVDPNVPTYHNDESAMNFNGIFPGLGFRPHLDPEDEMIRIDLADPAKTKEQHVDLMNRFLEKYESGRNQSFSAFNRGNFTFDYRKLIDGTDCAVENDYGFGTNSPCIVVKLNRIYGWKPEAISQSEVEKIIESEDYVVGTKTTKNGKNETEVEEEEDEKEEEKEESAKKPYVYVRCHGEKAFDKDQIGKITYYSTYPGNDIGGIHFKYFPYLNQPGYLSPLVFVRFGDLPANVLINVECKAYAKNIDNSDRANKQGMTTFQLFVSDISSDIPGLDESDKSEPNDKDENEKKEETEEQK